MAKVRSTWEQTTSAAQAAASMGPMAQRNCRQLVKRRSTGSGRRTGSMRGLHAAVAAALPELQHRSTSLQMQVARKELEDGQAVLRRAGSSASRVTVSSHVTPCVSIDVESYSLGKFTFKVGLTLSCQPHLRNVTSLPHMLRQAGALLWSFACV